MDALKGLSREAQVVLGGAALYVIFSFFAWQQFSFSGLRLPVSEWKGIGIVAGLLGFAVLAWELGRLVDADVRLGSLSVGFVSLGLALLLAVFTVITFLTHGTARHWPAWIGLILSLVIAVAAWARARQEGVQLPARTRGPAGGAPE